MTSLSLASLARVRPIVLGALLILLLVPAATASAAPDGVVLAPHRAVYDLSLATTRSGSGVTSVAGRMVYDLTGSSCDGYTQTMRFVTRMTNQAGATVVSDLRSTTWEDARGKRFRFDSSQYRDEKATETTVGDAARAGTSDDIKVELTKPAKKNIAIPSRVYFPVQHTIALLNAAKAGKASFRADLYDGSEKGEKTYDTAAAIGRAQSPGSNRELAHVKNTDRLNGLQAWPVSIAYFEPSEGKQDALPVYELSFLMFENGVSRKLYIDYGDFALEGDLSDISFHEPTKCGAKKG